jgi:Flp pilus assembly protein TadG
VLRISRPRRRGDEGAAAVEFALVLPILLMIIFAIIDFGRMFNAQLVLDDAARETARAAAVLNNAEAAEDRGRTAAGSLGTVQVTVTTPCPTNPSGQPADATVEVTYQFTFATPLSFMIGASGTKTLKSTSVMPCMG